MRNVMYNLFKDLDKNDTHFISYYEQNNRIQKSYAELLKDINVCISRLDYLHKASDNRNIGILGSTSYEWMVIDLACIKGGYKSIAIPESLTGAVIKQVIKENDVGMLLMDLSIKNKYANLDVPVYYINCASSSDRYNFQLVPLINDENNDGENKILAEYSIAFSSGTSSTLKRIILKFDPIPQKKKSFFRKCSDIIKWIQYKRSFWSRKDNKILIFMPFSHSQQRSFVLMGLMRKINITLSNPANCFRHLILEKPNIMIAVPLIYEALARQIEIKLKNLNSWRKWGAWLFYYSGIHSFSNRNLIKKWYAQILFRNIAKLYGGRADYFITGSALIDPSVLNTFYKIGVKIYQGYGISEIGTIAINTDKHYKLGSVGKPLLPLKISHDSEILVKYEENYLKHVSDILVINKEGYIHTGDMGFLDKEGYLFIRGRMDDVIILSNGKKIFPFTIEQKIGCYSLCKQALVFSKDSKTINAIIVTASSDNKSRYLNEAVSILKEINHSLSDHEKITGFYVTREPFTVDNGLLTGTLKIRRRAVIEWYKNESFLEVDSGIDNAVLRNGNH